MLLFHQSPSVFNVIRVKKSQGPRQRVWLSDEERLTHYYRHLCKHHGCRMHWLYKVDVPRGLLTELRPGVYVCYFDVPILSRHGIMEDDGCFPYMSFDKAF